MADREAGNLPEELAGAPCGKGSTSRRNGAARLWSPTVDYSRYYLGVIIQLVAGAGFILGGNWVWLGVATLPLLGLIDSLVGDDLAPRRMTSRALANVPLLLCALLAPFLYILGALWIAREPDASWSQLVGAALSLGWLSVVPLVPVTHELYHQRNRLVRFIGRYAQAGYLDATRDVAHVAGHHLDVATSSDGDTAPRGTNLYAFTGRAVIESSRLCWRIEADSLTRRGKPKWSIEHRMWRALAAQLLFHALIYLIAGLAGNALVLAAMVIARFWVESFNYFQHYGLVRVAGTRISRRHVWNHLRPLSRILGFEITNHADHHGDSYLPYYALVADRDRIAMPSVFLCFFAALIPPLWHRAIAMPALRRWDDELASPAERALAREQNRAAGWPDWFEDRAEPERLRGEALGI